MTRTPQSRTPVPVPSPFHRGEQALQARLGVRAQIEDQGRRMVRDFLPEQHRDFYRRLPFVILGAVDGQQRPWASILAAESGLLSSPDPHHLRVAGRPDPADPVAASLSQGAPVGLLGIMLDSRRRNRLNGRIEALDREGFTIAVDQAFGNCPQYIQTRALDAAPDRVQGPVRTIDRFDDAAAALIRSADTFFIASAAEEDPDDPIRHGADASHRGGRPGFVRVDDDRTLTIPDYVGNYHFNTLGNLLLNPRAGLLFIDFETGDLLQVTGTIEILWEGAEITAFRGAERLLRFTLDAGVFRPAALPIRWRFGDYSPNALLAGDWTEAAATLAAQRARETWRPFTVSRVVDESETVRSFSLTPADGGGRVPHEAGQFLPIRVTVPDGTVVERTYTVSSAPGDPEYRISVKREAEGTVSRHLHDRIQVGDTIQAKAPRGAFVLDTAETRPAVLLSAGVGITPMVSMLRHAVAEGIRTRHLRPISFIHGARTLSDRAFYAEVLHLARLGGGRVGVHYALSQPPEGLEPGAEYQSVGRISVDLLKQVLSFDDHDFYLCGPAGFMQDLYDGLRGLGVRDHRIHAEAFGPAGLTRRPDADGPQRADLPQGAAADQATIRLQTSGAQALWTPAKGSLLDAAEATGTPIPHGCRSGTCGTCAVKLVSGAVTYPTLPSARPGPGEVLTCSAVPAHPADGAAAEIVLAL